MVNFKENKMKIAACTICKNEEDNVAQWLEHTKDFDYRIVLDTGSIDKTIELFKKADVILYEKIFEPFDFSEARNHVLSLVPSNTHWIFWPDLDEYYCDNWREILEENSDLHNASRITYTTIHYKNGVSVIGEETGTTMDCKIHKANMYKWIKPIHEHLVPITDKDKHLHIDNIIRYHHQIPSEHRNKLYYDIAKRAADADPTDDWNVWFVLNESYKQQNADNVIKYGNIYLDLTKPYTDFRSLAHMFIAIATVQLHGVNQSVVISLLRSIAEDPNNERAKLLYTNITGNQI
ncbi:hypothetical protein LCGC14_1254350 [marine sediment metagenome]|uniref:Glycosyltransferase 2-like domain-containing protein n=1 Tax=marine sediment metagenome TaxID=412755 RepID=A0A0F9NJ60_9ZZZZ